jgi:hypothetical protein
MGYWRTGPVGRPRRWRSTNDTSVIKVLGKAQGVQLSAGFCIYGSVAVPLQGLTFIHLFSAFLGNLTRGMDVASMEDVGGTIEGKCRKRR